MVPKSIGHYSVEHCFRNVLPRVTEIDQICPNLGEVMLNLVQIAPKLGQNSATTAESWSNSATKDKRLMEKCSGGKCWSKFGASVQRPARWRVLSGDVSRISSPPPPPSLKQCSTAFWDLCVGTVGRPITTLRWALPNDPQDNSQGNPATDRTRLPAGHTISPRAAGPATRSPTAPTNARGRHRRRRLRRARRGR